MECIYIYIFDYTLIVQIPFTHDIDLYLLTDLDLACRLRRLFIFRTANVVVLFANIF